MARTADGADDRLHVDVGALAQLVEPLARPTVAPDDHRRAIGLDAVTQRRTHRCVLGEGGDDPQARSSSTTTPASASTTLISGCQFRSSWCSMRQPMSSLSMASVRSTNPWVPAGPMTGNGFASGDMAHRIVTMSLKSVM